ncbi:PREDICTED: agrin-like isoform X4 [Branchiostoma belcheri]|uniref:Agrin n=1 Tax=Branchiostoma belcheri TaxID=7741 RepID=A0A6P5A2U2_BRABE|nr:PREDICTED: agrin-like isoform X4 [Branchiostoma belcheri]
MYRGLLGLSAVLLAAFLARGAEGLDGDAPLRSNRQCHEDNLMKRVRRATAIVTGTVEQKMNGYPDGKYKAKVRVWRVMKGTNEIPTANRVQPLRDPSRGVAEVMVGGFGDPHICDNEVDQGDTRIFLLDKKPAGPPDEFELTSSLIRVTLDNLIHAESAVKGEPFTTREPPAPKDPCIAVFCGFGATCDPTQITSAGKGTCICEQTCSSGVIAPVCGSDDVTYSSKCNLELKSCQTQSRITVKKEGKCIQDPDSNPCYGKDCRYGSSCVVDGSTAKCVCPTCDEQTESTVCGDDGNDYKNECEMNKAGCSKKEEITLRFRGKCNPCDGFTCDKGVCILDDNRNPQCSCQQDCPAPDPLASICASNGKTYPSECLMLKEACETGRDLEVVDRSEGCESVYSAAKGKAVEGTFALSELDRRPAEFQAALEDPTSQEYKDLKDKLENALGASLGPGREVKIIGFKDGSIKVIFQIVLPPGSRENPEDVKEKLMEVLQDAPDLEIKPGTLVVEEAESCFGQVCEFSSECTINPRTRDADCSCESITCDESYVPVCGDNMVTYNNDCKRKQAECQEQKPIIVKYNGKCAPAKEALCENVKCGFGATCTVIEGNAMCECDTVCPAEFQPVCGSDGVSYNNMCYLQAESCERQQEIRKVDDRLCNGCENTTCRFGAICQSSSSVEALCVCPKSCIEVYSPVCGSDGKTYSNKCELEVASCNQQKHIRAVADMPCEDMDCGGAHCGPYQECVDDKCQCPTVCPARYDPVCGSDGITYNSECKLAVKACQDGLSVVVKAPGPCEDTVEVEGSGSGSGEEPEGSGTGDEEFDFCDEGSNCRFGGKCMDMDPDSEGEECICEIKCSGDIKPVCGTDKKTYENECRLKLAACTLQRHIQVMSNGPCPDRVKVFRQQFFSDVPPAPQKDCKETTYKCCPDGKTPAAGAGFAGCPSVCKCNSLGSYAQTCDSQSGQCSCKPGVGGKKCDRCEPGFWNFRGMQDGKIGCTPCECSKGGSVRDDCDQMTGKCVCKPGVSGMKCDRCRKGQVMGPTGCREPTQREPEVAESCDQLMCKYGAVCKKMSRDVAQCVCPTECKRGTIETKVCGSDGQTFADECQMRVIACRYQQDIRVAYAGPCKADVTTAAVTPTGRNTTCPTNLTRTPASENATDKPSMPEGTKETVLPTESTRVPPTSASVNLVTPTKKMSTFPPLKTTEKMRPPVTVTPPPPAPTPCSSVPCMHGGTCKRTNDGRSFECSCPAGWTGPVCEEEVFFYQPAFGGDSYIAFKTIKVFLSGTIMLDFRYTGKDGLLVYNGQKSGKDFISLAIVNGKLQFQYDLGSGPSEIIHSLPLEPNRWYAVTASRVKRDGYIRIGNEPDTTGASPGATTGLNLDDDFYVGNIPPEDRDRVYQRIGVTGGFKGCIRELKIIDQKGQEKMYDLRPNGKDMMFGVGVSECGSDPCKAKPCQNEGQCEVTNDGNFRCVCKQGFHGPLCGHAASDPCDPDPCHPDSLCTMKPEGGFQCRCPVGRRGMLCDEEIEDAQTFIPEFSGNSYIQRAGLTAVSKSLSAEVIFYATKNNGMLLYNGQKTDGKGDFVSLNLKDGYLVFRFNLGKGPADIRSEDPVTLNEWHEVKLDRNLRRGQMTLDGKVVGTGESPGTLSQLNLGLPLFIGGGEDYSTFARDADITTGFTGAIQKLVIAGAVVPDLVDGALAAVDIGNFEKHSCTRKNNPCKNGGACMPMMADYKCDCSGGYTGKRCEKAPSFGSDPAPLRLEGISLDGTTSLNYPNAINKKESNSIREQVPNQDNNHFEVTFRTTSDHGLLLWNHKPGGGDFIALAIVGGKPQLTYKLGKQPFTIESPISVNTGRWITIVADRTKREGSLEIVGVNGSIQKGESPPGASQLNTDGVLWIGGFSGALPSGLPSEYNSGFVGCIKDVKIDRQELDLLQNSIERRNLKPCNG